MKVWIVCDNNASGDTIIPYASLEAARKHQEQYEDDPIKAQDCWIFKDDCWIFDEDGTEVKQ